MNKVAFDMRNVQNLPSKITGQIKGEENRPCAVQRIH